MKVPKILRSSLKAAQFTEREFHLIPGRHTFTLSCTLCEVKLIRTLPSVRCLQLTRTKERTTVSASSCLAFPSAFSTLYSLFFLYYFSSLFSLFFGNFQCLGYFVLLPISIFMSTLPQHVHMISLQVKLVVVAEYIWLQGMPCDSRKGVVGNGSASHRELSYKYQKV